ncbi:MAG: hypothetical protein RI947_435 [Candidatus Parcubacteria bacterium]
MIVIVLVVQVAADNGSVGIPARQNGRPDSGSPCSHAVGEGSGQRGIGGAKHRDGHPSTLCPFAPPVGVGDRVSTSPLNYSDRALVGHGGDDWRFATMVAAYIGIARRHIDPPLPNMRYIERWSSSDELDDCLRHPTAFSATSPPGVTGDGIALSPFDDDDLTAVGNLVDHLRSDMHVSADIGVLA